MKQGLAAAKRDAQAPTGNPKTEVPKLNISPSRAPKGSVAVAAHPTDLAAAWRRDPSGEKERLPRRAALGELAGYTFVGHASDRGTQRSGRGSRGSLFSRGSKGMELGGVLQTAMGRDSPPGRQAVPEGLGAMARCPP